MTDCTGALIDESWRYSGCRDVYADLNALTLKITTQALFGDDLPPAEGVKVTGELRQWHSIVLIPMWPPDAPFQGGQTISRLQKPLLQAVDGGATSCLLSR